MWKMTPGKCRQTESRNGRIKVRLEEFKIKTIKQGKEAYYDIYKYNE